ncbi:MAG: replicative DNA helicase, partial [Candidatus Spyradenecus sp.]
MARRVPQSIEAERALLGAILIDSARVLELCAAKRVVPEAFVEPAHRCIYTAMMHLSSRGMPVDAVTLGECLRGMQEEAASAVGLEMLSELVISTPTSAHAGYYIGVVMEQYLRRQILGAVREVEERVYDPAQGADYVLGEAEQAILAIGEGRTQQGSTVDWKTSVGETLAMLTRQLDSPGQLSGLSTGFKALDEKTRGMHKGAMIVLAARPAMGKTSLAMNVAECVARGLDIMGRPIKSADGLRHKHTVLVFSLEMPQVQLTTRMLCGMAEVSAREVERGQFVKKEVVLPRLNAAARELADTPILCDDQGGLDVLELRARARHTHKKTPLDLIVIDYLQLLGYREYA